MNNNNYQIADENKNLFPDEKFKPVLGYLTDKTQPEIPELKRDIPKLPTQSFNPVSPQQQNNNSVNNPYALPSYIQNNQTSTQYQPPPQMSQFQQSPQMSQYQQSPQMSQYQQSPQMSQYQQSPQMYQNKTQQGINTTVNPNIEQLMLMFEQKVKTYISQYNPKLYILTPCFGSVCYVNYVNSLLLTKELFNKFGFPLQIEFCKGDSLVSRARNNLIAKAMTDPKTTHIMFIDNDITWDPLDVLKLILADKPLIGGVYPLKHYAFETLVKDPANPTSTNVVQSWIDKKNNSQLKSLMTDQDIIEYKLVHYNINYLGNTLTIDNNLAKVKHLATGFMMIQRGLIEKMAKAFPSTKYVDDVHFLLPHENTWAYGLFDTGCEEGHYYSEDWMFCSRWSKMGGDIFIDVSINLAHFGNAEYRGSFISSILS
jgi:hypothetical protein